MIQGDESSKVSQFGAHLMVMVGGTATVSGIQMFQAGQKSVLARYPFHWHMLGDIPSGQFIKNSSIYYSYNRCITVSTINRYIFQSTYC